jgi:alpha-L-arabinofuranosidase
MRLLNAHEDKHSRSNRNAPEITRRGNVSSASAAAAYFLGYCAVSLNGYVAILPCKGFNQVPQSSGADKRVQENGMKLSKIIATALAVIAAQTLVSGATIEVQADKPAHKISPTLWGIFFEDINCSADGGVYAELVRNRSLENSDKPEFWSLATTGAGKGAISVSTENPMNPDPLATRNRRSLKLEITSATKNDSVGAANEGYWGIALRDGAKYNLSFYARASSDFSGPLTVSLQGADGKIYARESVAELGGDWKKFEVTLTAAATDPKAKLVLSAAHTGTVWLDMISLFPQDTWKNHGLRPDLMNMLDGLKPAFMRFPGGCWVEGEWMDNAYRWKDTIGDPATRRTQRNIWEYWATHGLGFHEYLQMCEDLGAEPLFVINVGMAHKDSIGMDQLAPYVQDALDALEYCNGAVTTRYGALRAKNGHPAPFNLKFMEIGNEDGGPVYNEHWPVFYKAIKAKYPDVTLIANHWLGTYPKNPMPEVVDEHYYDSPEFFMSHANQYDAYDRYGPKVYIGEYAVTRGCGQGNLRGAIGEAAFMTGIERNSDIVSFASYAPLFANVNYKKWNPDLICYDSSRVYGLPSYYVQKLFSQNRGDELLPVKITTPKFQYSTTGGGIGVGTWMTRAEFKDIKVTQGDKILFASDFSKNFNGWKMLGAGRWSVKDGALVESVTNENIRAVIGDKSWKNYTLTLKARKDSGDEGFLVLFNVQDENSKSWWNIGGWSNTRHAIEMGGVNTHDVNGSVEAGRWYDIRVETSDAGIKCYLDGKLIHDASYPELDSIYASAARDDASGDIIVKIVNGSYSPIETDVHINGGLSLANTANGFVLTSASGDDENSLDKPENVVPVSKEFAVNHSTIHDSFPGNSLTVIRIKASKIAMTR